MCRLDLKDAYLLIPIHRDSKRFLRFQFLQQMYEFNALPFGLSSAPFIFTKLIKPLANYLRSRGIKMVVYLDDFLIFGTTREECRRHTDVTIALLTFLGLIVNWDKSDIEPMQSCKFLGMVIDSQDMVITLPPQKRAKIKETLEYTLNSQRIELQRLMELIGVLVAACPAIAYGWLYYKELERLKQRALFTYGYNGKKLLNLPTEAITELEWWKSHILKGKNKIRSSTFDLEIFTDASNTGWGAICDNKKAHGFWNETERKKHINYLEIKTAFLGLKCFARAMSHKQILLRIDNITALSYINKMGGTKHRLLHNLTKSLWEWCIERENWVFAEYVTSKDNIADKESRITNMDTEWELANYAYQDIC